MKGERVEVIGAHAGKSEVGEGMVVKGGVLCGKTDSSKITSRVIITFPVGRRVLYPL